MARQKEDVAFTELIERQRYLVVESNDLARAFNNLSALEHKVLDYCVSFIQQDSGIDDIFNIELSSLSKHLGMSKSGANYKHLANALIKLQDKTTINIKAIKKNGRPAIIHTPLFAYTETDNSGSIEFKFAEKAAPYLFELKNAYYSFHLGTLARVKSKYTLVLMKLWQANRRGNGATSTTIKGSLDEWESWFLPTERNEKGDAEQVKWPAGRFNQKVLNVAKTELENMKGMDVHIEIITLTRGRKTVGYEMSIEGNPDPELSIQ